MNGPTHTASGSSGQLELNRAGLTLETLHADVFGRRITPYEVGTLVFDLWAEGLALTFRAADGAPSVRPDDLRRLRAGPAPSRNKGACRERDLSRTHAKLDRRGRRFATAENAERWVDRIPPESPLKIRYSLTIGTLD